MAVTIATINPNDPISDGPGVLNANFTTIKQHIDDLEDLLNPSNNSLKLVNKVTIPANSIEADTISLTGASGILITINPDGAGATYTVDSDGDVVARKVTLSGTGANKSVIADLDITGNFTVTGATPNIATFDILLDLTATNSRVARKSNIFTIVDGNIGSGATAKVDISLEYICQFDYDNGASALAGNADVFLDITNFVEGQIFRIHCYRDNATGMALHNGGSGTEIFAFIEPNGAGYTTIAFGSLPTFNPSTTPDNQSYMMCQWTDIGSGVLRLVVLESTNMLNVS